MANINVKDMTELIDKIRGSTAEDVIKEQVEKTIKQDAEKAKAKSEADKKLKADIKKAADEIKKEKVKKPETKEKKKKEKKEKSTGDKDEEISEDDLEEDDEDEDDTEPKIKKLTDLMESMAKEIEALKKQKNYRMKPPKAKKVDELDDFIKQNSQIMAKDFEVMI